MTSKRLRAALVTGAAVLGVGFGGLGIAAATSDGGSAGEPPAEADDADDANETDTPITGTDLDKASAAALESTGGGTVTETEVGDEESYYEVEVTLEDGSQVDVQLDESFNVVGSEADSESDD